MALISTIRLTFHDFVNEVLAESITDAVEAKAQEYRSVDVAVGTVGASPYETLGREVQRIMSGVEWSTDTTAAIAEAAKALNIEIADLPDEEV